MDIFHKFDDGRINAQYRKNDSKGKMVHNMTLKPDEYKLNEAADDFYRLPDHVINNELYVAVKNLNAIQSSLRNGNDFDVSSFKSVITNLNAIAKQAKSFKTGKKVPVSYQYTTD